MYREIAGTDERVRAIPGVRDRQVRATKVRLYDKWILIAGGQGLLHSPPFSMGLVSMGFTCMMLVNYGL